MNALEFFLPKTTKGGKGSGHHGHSGLAGVHGGSSSSRGKYANFEKISMADARTEYALFDETMDKLGIGEHKRQADEKIRYACMMTQMALYDIANSGEEGFVVRNENGLVISAISYTKYTDPDEYGSRTMVIDHFGALEHGAGIRCLEQVFQVANREKLTVMGFSAHSHKITRGLQKRYGINVSGDLTYERVDIPPDNLPKILAVLKRALK